MLPTPAMRSSPVALTGGTLCFDRAGTRLLVVEPQAISVVDVAARRTTRLPAFVDARAVAGFDDQLWIATRDDQLVRTAPGGRVLGAPVALPFAGRGQLAPAPCGPAAAVWSSATPTALIDDFGTVVSTELDRELRSVGLWTLGAIATAWDSRRLGYGNEGRHPYELEVAAILGMGAGLAPEYLTAARDSLAAHERTLAGDPTWRARGTAVGDLMSELGLGDRAVDVLLVIAAAALLAETARLYGILANDAGRPLVDEALVQQVLAARYDRHDLAEELDPRAPLVRLGVVQISSRRPRPFAELTVDPVVLDRLRAIPPDLGAATAVRTSATDLGALEIKRAALEAKPLTGDEIMTIAKGPGGHA